MIPVPKQKRERERIVVKKKSNTNRLWDLMFVCMSRLHSVSVQLPALIYDPIVITYAAQFRPTGTFNFVRKYGKP